MFTNQFQNYTLIPYKGKLKDIVRTSKLLYKDITIVEKNKFKTIRIHYLMENKHAFIPSDIYKQHKKEVDKLFQGNMDENISITDNKWENDEMGTEKATGDKKDCLSNVQTIDQSDLSDIQFLMKTKDFSECPFEIVNPVIIPDKKCFFFLLTIQKKEKALDIESISINLVKGQSLHYYFKGHNNIPSDGYLTFYVKCKYKKLYIEVCLNDRCDSIYKVLYKTNAHGTVALKFIKKYQYKETENRVTQGITLKNQPSKRECYVSLREELGICKKCNSVDLSIKMIRYENKPRYYKSYFCKKCGIYYIPLHTYLMHANDWKIMNPKEIPQILERVNNKHEQNISAQDFVVKLSVLKCRKKNHPLEDLQATITTIDKNGDIVKITVPGGYCPKCKTYFILDSVYKRIKEKGIPICRVMDEKTYTMDTSNSVSHSHYDKLASESVLRQFGYNVNQTDNLSSVQRKRILAALVDYNILSKSEIISYLDYFINIRKGQKNPDGTCKMSNAIQKWKEDSVWISTYKIGGFKEIQVKSIMEK